MWHHCYELLVASQVCHRDIMGVTEVSWGVSWGCHRGVLGVSQGCHGVSQECHISAAMNLQVCSGVPGRNYKESCDSARVGREGDAYHAGGHQDIVC